MAASSGSLGGDDSSKLDALAKSIAENSEKLEILNRILSKTEDAGGTSKKKEGESTTDFLKGVEKLLSKQDIEAARSKSKQLQVDADRLASNTFRASETVISEVLSRLGGTSFYPVLSAFRVARESVATATETPQSELNVTDILKFVNQSTKELFSDVFNNLTDKVNSFRDSVKDLTGSTKDFSASQRKAREDVDKTTKTKRDFSLSAQDEIDIKEALAPITSGIIKELNDAAKLTEEEFSKLKFEDLSKFSLYIEALESVSLATEEQAKFLEKIKQELSQDPDSVTNTLDKEKLVQNLKKEKIEFASGKDVLGAKILEERASRSEIADQAIASSKLIAGIAGSLIPIGFALNDAKDVVRSIADLTSNFTRIPSNIASNPSGQPTLQPLGNVVQGATNLATNVGGIAGNIIGSLSPLGPVLGGPIGQFVGSAITSTLLAPVGIMVDTLISINNSVQQIADDLVGFSPEVTAAVIGQEIAILQDDFRRAAEIGPEIARITEAQTKLQLASRQAFDTLLEATEPYLVTIIELLTANINAVSGVVGIINEIAKYIPGIDLTLLAIRGLAGGMSSDLSDISNALNTDDPLELNSIANQGGMQFFMNNPAASVKLK